MTLAARRLLAVGLDLYLLRKARRPRRIGGVTARAKIEFVDCSRLGDLRVGCVRGQSAVAGLAADASVGVVGELSRHVLVAVRLATAVAAGEVEWPVSNVLERPGSEMAELTEARRHQEGSDPEEEQPASEEEQCQANQMLGVAQHLSHARSSA